MQCMPYAGSSARRITCVCQAAVMLALDQQYRRQSACDAKSDSGFELSMFDSYREHYSGDSHGAGTAMLLWAQRKHSPATKLPRLVCRTQTRSTQSNNRFGDGMNKSANTCVSCIGCMYTSIDPGTLCTLSTIISFQVSATSPHKPRRRVEHEGIVCQAILLMGLFIHE
jgi:hypothetical protein